MKFRSPQKIMILISIVGLLFVFLMIKQTAFFEEEDACKVKEIQNIVSILKINDRIDDIFPFIRNGNVNYIVYNENKSFYYVSEVNQLKKLEGRFTVSVTKMIDNIFILHLVKKTADLVLEFDDNHKLSEFHCSEFLTGL